MKRVLAIEDDPGITSIYRRILGPLDLEVIDVDACEKAFELLSHSEHRFDLVIADLILPDANLHKLALTEPWRPLTNRYAFLAVSVVDDLAILESCLSTWAKDFLVKPFNNNELLAKCKKLLDPLLSLSFDMANMTICNRNRISEELTAKEFKMLAHLHKQGGQSEIVTFLKNVWGRSGNMQNLYTALSRLRVKTRPLGVDIVLSHQEDIIRLQTEEHC